jgi:3-hydroxy-9,10-secoandrosta-1,3,5(10)-triene-9,17-dione monooxygenase reductase component
VSRAVLDARGVNRADRKRAMRMIPYGVFVVTAIDAATGEAAAATVHWLTQTSFEPCLLMASLKAGDPVLRIIRATNRFAVNMLGKEDAGEAFAFDRPTRLTGSLQDGTARMGGYGVMWGRHANMLLLAAVAVLECEMRAILEAGDHHPVIAEVIDVHVRLPEDGRPDEMVLHQRELGATRFYGG